MVGGGPVSRILDFFLDASALAVVGEEGDDGAGLEVAWGYSGDKIPISRKLPMRRLGLIALATTLRLLVLP